MSFETQHKTNKKKGSSHQNGQLNGGNNNSIMSPHGVGPAVHLHNGHSINSVYAHRTYDALSIMSAHAAFLAMRHGARPAELVAAVDEARVRAAMDRYSPTGSTKVAVHSIGFPLSRRDCAAVLVAHALVRAGSDDAPLVTERDLSVFADIFNQQQQQQQQHHHHHYHHHNHYQQQQKQKQNTLYYDHADVDAADVAATAAGREALMEVMAACGMWHCLERYATGALAFDIDFASNMAFGNGRAEPAISQFCASVDGKKIGLSLAANELARIGSSSHSTSGGGGGGAGGGGRARGRSDANAGSRQQTQHGQGYGGHGHAHGQGVGVFGQGKGNGGGGGVTGRTRSKTRNRQEKKANEGANTAGTGGGGGGGGGQRLKRGHRKRTSSALNSSASVGVM